MGWTLTKATIAPFQYLAPNRQWIRAVSITIANFAAYSRYDGIRLIRPASATLLTIRDGLPHTLPPSVSIAFHRSLLTGGPDCRGFWIEGVVGLQLQLEIDLEIEV